MEKKQLLVVQGWVYAEEQLCGPAAPAVPQFVNVKGELKVYSGIPAGQSFLCTDLMAGYAM